MRSSAWSVVLTGVAGMAVSMASPALAGPTGEGFSDTALKLDVSFQDRRQHSMASRPGTLGPNGKPASGDPEDMGPIAVCFDPKYPPSAEMMERVNRAMQDGYVSRYNAGDRWAIGALGDPITLSWSFVPDGLSIPSGIGEGTANSSLFSSMDSKFAAVGGRAAWIAAIEACFARWSALSGVNYIRVTNGTNDWDSGAAWGTAGNDTTVGDVRIAMKPLDGASGVLAYNAFPDNGDMVLDSGESWGSSANNFRFLRNVVLHEHGHGLGFSHVCPIAQTKLMEPFYSSAFDGPQQDDIRAIQRNYGDINENNNTSAAATPVGAIANGAVVTLGNVPSPIVANAATLSIDGNGDVDYYSFSLDAPRLLDVTVTPVGSTYNDTDQLANGQCDTGTNNVNALAIADLVVTVYGQDGTTPFRIQNGAAAGLNETINDLVVGPSGTYFIRVSENDSPAQSQLYRLTINVNNTNIRPTASDGTFEGFVRLNWFNVTDATSYQVLRNTVDDYNTATQIADITTNTFDDTTAIPNTTYFYFVRVRQPGNFLHRPMNTSGETGFAIAANLPPTANAGTDQAVTDADNSLSEQVTLNGAASFDTDGTIINYRWTLGATVLAQGASSSAVVSLPVGVHVVTLTVTDNDSAIDTDDVQITVNPASNNCGTADFDGDGDTGTDADIEAFFACLGGSCCPTCGTADFDGDGDTGTDADIEAFFRVLGGGNC